MASRGSGRGSRRYFCCARCWRSRHRFGRRDRTPSWWRGRGRDRIRHYRLRGRSVETAPFRAAAVVARRRHPAPPPSPLPSSAAPPPDRAAPPWRTRRTRNIGISDRPGVTHANSDLRAQPHLSRAHRNGLAAHFLILLVIADIRHSGVGGRETPISPPIQWGRAHSRLKRTRRRADDGEEAFHRARGRLCRG
jgi:hypothetical protein